MVSAVRDQNDPRRSYGHQAYDITYLGMSPETAPSGADQRLAATYQASMLFDIPDCGVTTAQAVGDVTIGVWSFQIVNHRAMTSGTLALTLPAYNGYPAINLTTALNLTTIGIVNLDNPISDGLLSDRPMTATVAAGTAGERALLSLLVTPIENGWY